MSASRIKEDCLRCQFGTLNGNRGDKLITCDKFGWRVLKLVAGADSVLADLTGFMK